MDARPFTEPEILAALKALNVNLPDELVSAHDDDEDVRCAVLLTALHQRVEADLRSRLRSGGHGASYRKLLATLPERWPLEADHFALAEFELGNAGSRCGRLARQHDAVDGHRAVHESGGDELEVDVHVLTAYEAAWLAESALSLCQSDPRGMSSIFRSAQGHFLQLTDAYRQLRDAYRQERDRLASDSQTGERKRQEADLSATMHGAGSDLVGHGIALPANWQHCWRADHPEDREPDWDRLTALLGAAISRCRDCRDAALLAIADQPAAVAFMVDQIDRHLIDGADYLSDMQNAEIERIDLLPPADQPSGFEFRTIRLSGLSPTARLQKLTSATTFQRRLLARISLTPLRVLWHDQLTQ